MNALSKAYKKALSALSKDATEEEKKDAQLSALDLTIFENIAWLMLRHGGEEVGDDPNEWLDSIDGIFSIYEIFPEIYSLWNASNATTSIPKKK